VPVPVPDDGHTLTQALMKACAAPQAGARRPRAPEAARALRGQGHGRSPRRRPRRTARSSRSGASSPRTCCPSGTRASPRSAGATTCSASPAARWHASVPASSHASAASRRRLAALPEEVRERLEAEGLTGTVRSTFATPRPRCHRAVQRSHPLVAVLAETLLERTLTDCRRPRSRQSSGASAAGSPAGHGPHGRGAAPPAPPAHRAPVSTTSWSRRPRRRLDRPR
jgi:hypothetical protein